MEGWLGATALMEKWLGDWAERQRAYCEAGAENEIANQLAYEDMLIK